MRSIVRRESRKGHRKEAALPPVESEPEARNRQLVEDIEGLGADEERIRRKHAAALATKLSDVQGEVDTKSVLKALDSADAAGRLLALLQDLDADQYRVARSEERRREDLILAKSVLSCVASYTYLGGVRQLQTAGGLLLLLKLMRYDDATVRAYACAALQNASSFLELLKVEELTKNELEELARLCDDGDASIAEPAKMIRSNLEQDRRFQVCLPITDLACPTALSLLLHSSLHRRVRVIRPESSLSLKQKRKLRLTHLPKCVRIQVRACLYTRSVGWF